MARIYTLDYVKDIIKRTTDQARSSLEENKPTEAEVVLKQLLRSLGSFDKEQLNEDESKTINTGLSSAYHMLAMCSHKKQEYDNGIERFQEALKIDPENPEHYANMALCYIFKGNIDLAIDCMNKAVALKEDYRFYNNLAVNLRIVGKYDEAIEILEKALSLKEEAQILANLGAVYGEKKELNKAISCLKRAIELEPDLMQAHLDLASCYQWTGNYKEAWKEYENRFDHFVSLKTHKEVYDKNRKWDGEKDLTNKRLIVYCEQGLGDCINFIRYVKYLKEKGAYVIIHCSPVQEAFIRRLNCADELLSKDVILIKQDGSGLPEYDYHLSIMSLPYLLKMYEPKPEVYITPPADRVANFDNYKGLFKIGIAWAGSPRHPNDLKRSCKLSLFKGLHDIPGVKLFSLNFGPNVRKSMFCPQEIDLTEGSEGMRVVDMMEFIKDFDDMAVLVDGLDLIICVDTALLHLAGAMGKKAFGLLPYISDWRWGAESETTPWYKNVRLFRQTIRDDWKNAFERVEEAVKKEISLANLLQDK